MRNALGDQNATIYTTKHPSTPFFHGILFHLFTFQATSPAEERQDVTVLYNKMTLGELQNTYSLNVSAMPPFLLCVLGDGPEKEAASSTVWERKAEPVIEDVSTAISLLGIAEQLQQL